MTPDRNRRPRVAVVFGGRSSEHGVSCLTAGEVIAAIDPDRYEVVPIGITTEGRWVLESAGPGRFAISAQGLPTVDPERAEVVLASDPHRRELLVSEPGEVPHTLGEVDVVMPLLHGPWGEDGTIQGLFELAGVRYVGAGVLASAIGMDKHYMKLVFAAAGLPQLPNVVVRPQEWRDDPSAVRESVAAVGYPVFVKPARAGSSFGVSRVEVPGAFDAAVEVAQQYDPTVLVDAAALGARELGCGLLQGRDGSAPEASVVGEIELDRSSGHTFYDFEAKYVDGAGVARVPADIPADVADRAREWAVAAFEAISAEGLARVDFFWLPDGELLVNEINTMPGFTPTSMFPMLWAASELDYPALVDRLIGLALDRSTGLR